MKLDIVDAAAGWVLLDERRRRVRQGCAASSTATAAAGAFELVAYDEEDAEAEPSDEKRDETSMLKGRKGEGVVMGVSMICGGSERMRFDEGEV